ncbi:MAG: T9SS type A sorting domain-containing protein [Chitinophagales bacterium]|nr:T9SS type A sorting domain-containing protein [Chitinophagales bacterium]
MKLIKYILILSSFLLIGTSALCQSTFSITLDKDSAWQFSGKMIRLVNGNYLLASGSSDKVSTVQGELIFEISENGDIKNSFFYRVPGLSMNLIEFSELRQDGGFYACGFVQSSTINEFDILIANHSPNGDTLWTKYIDSINEGVYDIALHLNGFLITGLQNDFNITDSDIILSKYHSNGNHQWTRYYGGVENDRGLSLYVTNSNEILIGGETSSYGNGPSANYMVKTDSSGIQKDQIVYSTNKTDGGVGFLRKSTDSFLIVRGVLDTIVEPSVQYIARIDLDGNVMWRYFFKTSPSNLISLWGGSVHKNSVYVCGNYAHSQQGYIAKLNSKGQIVWERKYTTRNFPHFSHQYYITDIHIMDNGDILTLGTAPSITDTTRFDRDIWVMRLDSMGCLVPGCDTLVGLEEVSIVPQLMIYPNPAKNSTKILLERPLQSRIEIYLFNNLGEKVLKTNADPTTLDITLNLESFQSGLYFVQIVSNEGVIGNGKVIVQK